MSKERIYLSPPHADGRERELLMDAFDSNWIAPLGPHVDGFENEFAAQVGTGHAVALSSGTAALHLALEMHGVKAGGQVLTSSFTFVATANAIRYCGAEPVFLDSDWETWNMDPNLLEDELHSCAKMNRMPAAVLAVDVNGQCANYPAIEALCDRFGVPLIEDAAESLGAKLGQKNAGQFGRCACFSFNGNKIITTSGGGMLVTEDADLAERARFLATQARDPAPHYQHSVCGYNYRLSNLLAAVGRAQLEKLSEKVDARRRVFAYYQNALSDVPGIEFMPEPEGYYSTRWLTALTIDPAKAGVDREQIRLALADENIEARPLWKPMHMQPVFKECQSRNRMVSESLFEFGLCLPSGSGMTNQQLQRVTDIILNTVNSSVPTT
ncbi:MAG: aminotransferase class I/II-fold pyridoxal phosphate-dependent enzyme [Planctomycetota bacterium]